MRVIAGSARRLLLEAPAGFNTRPTSDKVKETLFNILMPYIYSDTRFLDLYSGSGAIGIEALSRGVESAVFVERSRDAINCINKNLNTTHFTDRAQVINSDVLTALNRLEGRKSFDMIFMDPPYDCGYERAVLEYLSNSAVADKDALIIVEASNDTDFDWIDTLGYRVIKYKRYKNNCHLFLKRESDFKEADNEECDIPGQL